jgi:hypothetical protein
MRETGQRVSSIGGSATAVEDCCKACYEAFENWHFSELFRGVSSQAVLSEKLLSIRQPPSLVMNKGRRAAADPSAAVGMTVWWG